MGPQHGFVRKRPVLSFAAAWAQGAPVDGLYGVYWHPGFAWAARRDALSRLGGLIDFAILGSADWHMAHALVGTVDRTIGKHLTPAYVQRLLAWQERAEHHIQHNLGFLPGALLHGWHGRKADRRYQNRWRIIGEGQFDPNADIYTDETNFGLLEWAPATSQRRRKMRDDTRNYFQSRNEDSIDLA